MLLCGIKQILKQQVIYVHTQKGEGATLDFLNTDLCWNAGISSERSGEGNTSWSLESDQSWR